MTGRISKLTDNVQEAICAALQIGCTYKMAAAYGGITDRTLASWRESGREARDKQERGERLTTKERRHLQFLQATDDSQAMAGVQWQQIIDDAARRDPQWAWRMLQARFPDDYRPAATRTELTGADAGPVVIQMTWGDVDDGSNRADGGD